MGLPGEHGRAISSQLVLRSLQNMLRKPSAILDYKLRIREILRRRIEAAAKQRGVSLNYEMTSRLERSFDQESQRTIDDTARGIELHWAHWEAAFHKLNRQSDLLIAAEALIKVIDEAPPEVQTLKAIKTAVAAVKQVVVSIDAEAKIVARARH
jgi:hypothetical protein